MQDIEFDDKTVSVNISGNCAWIAYEQVNFGYGGDNITLIPDREYGGLPGGLLKSISSLRMVAHKNTDHNRHANGNGNPKHDEKNEQPKYIAGNTVARFWAFKTIRDILDKASENEITKMELEKAYSLAMKYNFLTPFTIMNFVETNLFTTEPNIDYITEPLDPGFIPISITYGDLSPIFYNGGMMEKWEALKECKPPIDCEGKYHIERYTNHTDEIGNQTKQFAFDTKVNCTGSITLYTKSNYTGESLRIEQEDIYQMYHEINGQRIKSIQTEGETMVLFLTLV